MNLSKQYSFNTMQLERKKKFQSEASDPPMLSGAGSLDSCSTPSSSNTVMSLNTEMTSNASMSSNSSVSFIPGVNWKPYEKSVDASPSKSRGRGRGKIKHQIKICSPGGGNSETAPMDVESTMSTNAPVEKIVEKNANGADVKVKGPCPLGDQRRKPGGFKRSPNLDYKRKFDLRAVSCETLQTSLISHILEYNRTRSEKEFQRNIYSCQICFDVRTFFFLLPILILNMSKKESIFSILSIFCFRTNLEASVWSSWVVDIFFVENV